MKKNNKNKLPVNPLVFFLIISIVSTVLLNMALSSLTSPETSEISYSEFLTLVEEDKVEKVLFSGNNIEIHEKKQEAEKKEPTSVMDLWSIGFSEAETKKVYYTGYIRDDRLLPVLDEHGIDYSTPVYHHNAVLDFFVQWVMPLILIYGLFFIVSRVMTKKMGGGGFMGVGQSNAKLYMESETGVSF